MTWKYYRPTFAYKEALDKSLDAFGWVGHINFAYDLVSNTKPKVIVELGTHWGVSFFAFCQAVKDNHSSAHLHAIDTWRGEEHAGFYGEEVIDKVKEIKEKYFPSLRIELHRKTFDEALTDFADQSIDLLHLDGLHTYEAVKHDFENWLPKLKRDGLVLFHDTTEKGRGFEVYRFWGELVKQYHHTIMLPHSHGLGFLCQNERIWRVIESLLPSWQAYYSLSHQKELAVEELTKTIRELTEELSRTREVLAGVVNEKAALSRDNRRLTANLKETAQHAENLQSMLDDIHHSKVFRLARRLGNLRRTITGRS